jgi:hypothetical protein
MSNGNEIAIREQQGQALPAQTIEERKKQTNDIIEMSTYWASKLMEVVDKCGLSKQMSGKTYLEVEGWLMISEFAHVRPVIEWVKPWYEGETMLGYEARCQLFDDDGRVVGAGESSCGLDAFPCRGKQGSEKDKAAKSAAQTWAISRALRNKFSYIAKIAKYEAVPAEEMYHDREPAHDSREDLITTKPKGVTGAQLGAAILEYTNKDGEAAKQILQAICGKTTLVGMTTAEATVAYKAFEKEYLSSQPGDDNVPEFEAPK